MLHTTAQCGLVTVGMHLHSSGTQGVGNLQLICYDQPRTTIGLKEAGAGASSMVIVLSLQYAAV